MIENNVNIIDMEKEQLKQVLKNIAKQNNMTASDLAVQAGVAPSTITGFLNDVPGRGHYGLSARTQGKISDAFPEFREQIDTPPRLEQTVDVPVIGQWGKDYRVHPLDLGMSNTFISKDSPNLQNLVSVIRLPIFFKHNFESDKNNLEIKDTRYYLFEKNYAENIAELCCKQVYASCENGVYIGFLDDLSPKRNCSGDFGLADFFGNKLNTGKVLNAQKIEWTRQV